MKDRLSTLCIILKSWLLLGHSLEETQDYHFKTFKSGDNLKPDKNIEDFKNKND